MGVPDGDVGGWFVSIVTAAATLEMEHQTTAVRQRRFRSYRRWYQPVRIESQHFKPLVVRLVTESPRAARLQMNTATWLVLCL
jgi:hypothetical protein